MADEAQQGADLLGALARAEPAWVKDGTGLKGPQPAARVAPKDGDPTVRFPDVPLRREPRQPFFPEKDPTAAVTGEAEAVPNISFILSDASDADSKKLLVTDGKIKGTFPDGMGFGNYELTIPDPTDCYIYAMATFNPETLEITSRSMGTSTAAAFPESRVDEDGGFLYWQIGFTWLDADGIFKFLNTRVGDINFELVYGADNAGRAAVLPVESGPGWLDLDSLFP